MPLTKEEKQVHIGKFGKHETDTGSPEVQIAMLTQRINDLTDHLQDAPARSLLAPWPPEARRPSPPLSELPATQGSRGLSRPHQGTRLAPLVPLKPGRVEV